MSLFRLPGSPDIVAVPSVLGLVYLITRSTASVFPTIRSKLPSQIVRYTVPTLFYVHILEALLAGFRSIQANRPLLETLQWMAATFVWGFASLGQQKRMLKIKK